MLVEEIKNGHRFDIIDTSYPNKFKCYKCNIEVWKSYDVKPSFYYIENSNLLPITSCSEYTMKQIMK